MPAISVRIAAAVLPLLFVDCAAVHLARVALNDRPVTAPVRPGTANDASRLNETAIRETVDVEADDARAAAAIRAALARARAAKAGVSVAGARHSMGGQTIAPDGIVLNMRPHNRMELTGEVLRVQSGATWTEVVAYLDGHGRSVAVMQSDSPFTVGGSLSVNCHGWQHLQEPVAETVLAMTVMTPDGALTRCSRTESPTLFSHVLGGYGLFGVILDADLRTVPNERYAVAHTACDVDSYEEVFDRKVRGQPVGMAYGRISVAPRSFLREAIVTTYQREPGTPPALRMQAPSRLARLVFRGSVGSDYGKNLRWSLEKRFASRFESKHVSRNELLSHSIELYVERGGEATDILHEYFVPRGKLAPFIDSIRPLLRREHIDLLNITVRDVKEDRTTALPYARKDVFALVMFFSQKKTQAAEQAMQDLTRELIEKVLAAGGTYYLPYRLHATPGQFHRAYPGADEFFREKQRVDPDRLFTNQWYLRYGETSLPGAPGSQPGVTREKPPG